jgi:hypothetical protein
MIPYPIYLACQKGSGSPFNTQTTGIGRATTIDGYTPRNKKLLTFPYCYLVLDVLNDSAVYKYESFTDPSNIFFAIYCSLTPDPEIIFIPVNYENVDTNAVYAMTMKGYPQCAFIIDSYRSWLATRAGTDITSLLGSGTSAIGGVVGKAGNALNEANVASTTGSIAGEASAVLGGVTAGIGAVATGLGISSGIIGMAKEASQGNKPRGTQGAGTLVGANKLKPHIRRMSITSKFAKMIDSFFDRYGYTTNLVKVPNRVRSGKTFCFCQTNECNITGAIPAKDMAKIKSVYDKGVTFWTSLGAIGDYPT